MPDREKVIKGLESLRDVCIAKSDMAIGEGRKAWAGYASVVHLALDLLREQEPVEPEIRTAKVSIFFDGDCEIAVAHCGCCGTEIEQPIEGEGGWKYCPYCGKKVKWK